MDTRLMELLVCPICKGPLTHERADRQTFELHCAADRLAFPVRDGIPVMLEAEARALEEPGSQPSPLDPDAAS
ncbi:MAG TPA: Trm112 family protein [Methylibium sp.]|nr:Trm112 family protein [Methylibium sp.]